MARPLNQFLIEFLTAEAGESHTTAKFLLKNGQVRRFATTDIVINSELYTGDLITSDDITESEDSTTDKTQITIQNADKAIGLDIKNGLIHFAEVSIGRVFRRVDGTFEWREMFFGEAIPAGYNEKEAVINVVDDMVAASYCVANWTLAPICQLIFKSPECGSTAAETVCNKLLKGDCTKFQRTFRNVSETYPDDRNIEVAQPPTAIDFGGRFDIEDEALGRFKSRYINYEIPTYLNL